MSNALLMQNDHKHWFAEIDRWEGYAGAWIDEDHGLLDEFEALLKSVRKYGEELHAHTAALREHRNQIVACERAMVEGGPSGPSLAAEKHRCSEQGHAELRRVHERLKQTHHALAAALAILKHEPRRD